MAWRLALAWAPLLLIFSALRVDAANPLPDGPLVVGYATSCPADAPGGISNKVIQDVGRGVNVVIWFQANLGADKKFELSKSIDLDCIARTAEFIKRLGLNPAHSLSVGGWDAPHPNTTYSGEAWADAFLKWNTMVVSRHGWQGFDGLDWDLEGNDDVSSPFNHFTVACLKLMASMSTRLYIMGYAVSMAPPESYMDPTRGGFDRSLLHSYDDGWHPDFKYHGLNTYAYLLGATDPEVSQLIDLAPRAHSLNFSLSY